MGDLETDLLGRALGRRIGQAFGEKHGRELFGLRPAVVPTNVGQDEHALAAEQGASPKARIGHAALIGQLGRGPQALVVAPDTALPTPVFAGVVQVGRAKLVLVVGRHQLGQVDRAAQV